MAKGLTLRPVGMQMVDEGPGGWVVHRLDDEGSPRVLVGRDVLLWCGRWLVGRLVQYGRYVAPNVGVVNPTHWCELPPELPR